MSTLLIEVEVTTDNEVFIYEEVIENYIDFNNEGDHTVRMSTTRVGKCRGSVVARGTNHEAVRAEVKRCIDEITSLSVLTKTPVLHYID